MAKADFGEYSAFTTKNSVRYQRNSKLVSETSVPVEVVAYLNKQLGYTPKVVEQKFPMPTEEEKARLREESLRVKPELQGASSGTVTEEQVAAPVEEPLTEDDFEEPTPIEDLAPGVATYELDGKTETGNPPTDDDMSEFMESVSIHTASIQDMVDALYQRFGVYTVYLGRQPEHDEINPLTGELFTKYHLGIAYQAAIRAQHSGVLTQPAETGRMRMDEGREAAANFQVDPTPRTVAEARRANSFDYRTSVRGNQTIATTEIVHELQPDGTVIAVRRPIENPELGGTVNGTRSRYDAEEDEPIVEPQFGKQVIRPNW